MKHKALNLSTTEPRQLLLHYLGKLLERMSNAPYKVLKGRVIQQYMHLFVTYTTTSICLALKLFPYKDDVLRNSKDSMSSLG